MKIDGKSKTMPEMLDAYGVTVAGLAMIVQIAELLRDSPAGITISDNARKDTLDWLAAWEAQARGKKC